MHKFFLGLIFLLQNVFVSAQIIAPNAKLVLIDSNFSFTEGASTDKDGNVFFTDQPKDNIWKYSTNGKLSLFMHGAGRSNGMYFDAQGNLISCADAHDELISISPDKKIKTLIKDYNGHVLNGPNDVWVNRLNGNIYITDPYYQRDYWTRTKPDSLLGGEKLYVLLSEKSTLMLVDSSVKKPNGIVGSADGKYLYVADMGDWKTYCYDIAADGLLSNKKILINEASDGMTIDEKGNLYLTGKGVDVFDSTGNKIDHIDVPESWTANICFGGKNKDILFITASKSFYSIQTTMHGVE